MSRKMLMMVSMVGLLMSATAVTAAPASAQYNRPTRCVVTANRPGPPAQQDVTVTDLDRIKRIYNIHVINGTVAPPVYSANRTKAVLTATKANQSKRTFWEFDVEDFLGKKRHCV